MSMRSRATPGRATPDEWADTLSRPPLVDMAIGGGCLVRRWRDTHPEVVQPGLDSHLVVLHLGSPKRVERLGEGACLVADVAPHAISVVPEGAAYAWTTRGPTDYAHVYVSPTRAAKAAQAIFDRDGRGIALHESVGGEDPVLSGLMWGMLEEARAEGGGDPLYLDTLAEAFLARLLRSHSDLGRAGPRARYALAPRRLAEVVAYVEANLVEELTLARLAAVARLSRFHFSRAFAQATGVPPHTFVVQRRLEAAKALLQATDLSIEHVARRCGFADASHFSARFRRSFGVTPSAYRQDR
jgi:AraC family transcriptional regulator